MNENEIYKKIKENRDIEFLNPTISDLNLFRFNPIRLRDIEDIKTLLHIHKKFESKVLVYHDYDVDGIVGGFILYDYLNNNGYNTSMKMSDRRSGYGFSDEEVQAIIDRDIDLVITVDLGINENEQIKRLQKNNVEVIVTDHHKSDNPPNCFCLNAKIDDRYFFKNLSGTGIVWKLINFIAGKPQTEYLDLVAISNIADSVPLVDENRVITKLGLDKLNKNPFHTVEKMLKEFDIKGKITSTDVGFQIAPAINSVNRLKYSTIPSEILMGRDIKENTREMIKLNKKRKREIDKAINNLEVDDTHNIIIARGSFKAGFTGLIANKLVDKYKTPAIVINQNLKGSSRSIAPLKITDILTNKSEFFESIGGHDYASGFTLKEGKFDKLKSYMYAKTEGYEYETQKADMVLEDLTPINEKLVGKLEELQPFGVRNPQPLFRVENKELDNYRTTRDNKHLQFTLDKIRGIWFNYNIQVELRNKINMNFEVQKDDYRGTGVQLIARKVEES